MGKIIYIVQIFKKKGKLLCVMSVSVILYIQFQNRE